MEKNYSQSDAEILDYAKNTFAPSDPVLENAIKQMRGAGLPMIQVGEFDGLHLEVLTRAFGVTKAVEIGTLGGYSAICIARGLRSKGFLWTIEYEQKHFDIATQVIANAGFKDRVGLLHGTALGELKKIENDGPFDLVFIDADKVNYPNYYKWAVENLRVGGVLVADNTFAFGYIAQKNIADPELRASVEALREFNRLMAQEGKFRSTILPTGEGLTVGVKL